MGTCFRRLRRTREMCSLSKSKINSQAPLGVWLYPQAHRTAFVLRTVHVPCCNNPTCTGQYSRISEVDWICSFKIIKFKKKKKIQFLFILTAFPGEEFYNVQTEKNILGQKTDTREIFQKRVAWDISDSWQIANLHRLLLIIGVQVECSKGPAPTCETRLQLQSWTPSNKTLS